MRTPALAALLLAAALPLAGCNTVEGLGKDIGASGNAISGFARDVRAGNAPKGACRTTAGRPSDIDACKEPGRR